MASYPLLSGIAATEQGEFKRSYPLNLEPVAIDNRISKGQLRAAAGAVPWASGPGICRGAIAWNNLCYRVMGTKLVRVSADGTVLTLGDVGGAGPVSLDYSFDRIILRSGTGLWYYDGVTLNQVTDPDLGYVVDAIWVGGYTMATDGTSIVVTELADPFSVMPLKYGSAEIDPDPITGLIKLEQSDEAYALGRYTIQVFENLGGNGFPFQTVKGATIPYGCVSASAKCKLAERFAFVGSAKGQALGVYFAGDGTATKISTREIDDALAAEADPTAIELEARAYRDEQRLVIHLAEQSWVFLYEASKRVGEPVWYRAQSGRGRPYRLRHAVLCYGKWIVGDTESNAIGVLSEDLKSHFGEECEWEVGLGLVYNQAKAGLMHSVELVGLPGRGGDGSAFLSISRDGENWSAEQMVSWRRGDRGARLQWRPHVRFGNWMGLKFRGYDGAMPGFAKLEADIRPLSV